MAGGGIRGAMGTLSLVLIAGALLLMFFVVLSGVANTTPLTKTWFLRADTSSFPGADRAQSYWTYWKVCANGGRECGAPVPGLQLGQAWVGGTDGVPAGLVGSHKHTSTYYYYMWRFGWVFYLVSIVFTGLTFVVSLLAPCSRLAAGVSGAMLANALFWFSLAAALMTITFVKARNEFRDAGISASIGRYAFGFTWGAWAAMFLATIFLFLGCGASSRRKETYTEDNVRSAGPAAGGLQFWKRQRHTSKRSTRGSFVDTESAPRVKEEY